MTEPPPRFVIDRSLGKAVAAHLIEHGWDCVLIQDIFPDDARNTLDETWLAWGNTHADAALTKDADIRRHWWYDAAEMPIFALARQDLKIDEMVALFLAQEKRIHRVAASRPGRQFWTLYRNGSMARAVERPMRPPD
ncbi:MAG: hypothetical protein FWC46_04610 [Actinomycetia bacterium]|nr:hypothetical protein [Actinomycetes bacterium]